MKRFWYTVLTLVAIAVAFCDAVALHFTASNTTSSVNGKTLMIMIEATTQNGAAVNSLVTNAHFLNEIDQEWFKTFIVIAFDATGVLRSVVTTNYYEVYGALSLIAHSLTGNSTCEEAFLGAAIDSIWRNNAAPDSIVYIITSAGSFNADQTEYLGINRNTQPSIHLQYILVKNPACPYTINNTYDPTFMTAWIAVNFESGNVFKIDAENVGSFVQAHLPTLYRTKLAANPTNAFTCLDTVFDFNVEPDVRTIYLYSLSANATPIISRGYASYSLNTVFDDGYARILSLIPDSPGKYTVALTAYGDCNLQIRFEGDFEANTTPTTPIPNQYQNVQADITLILDVGGDVPIDKRADLRNFFMNALAQFDVGWEHNLHVSIIIAYGDDGIQVYYIYGFKDILDLSTLNKALAHVYNDTNSKKGGQTVLSDTIISALTSSSLAGYRNNINNHLIVYATTNGTADAAAITAAASVVSSGKYSIAAVAYSADGSNTASLTSLVGGKAGCVITANDSNGLTTTAANALVTLIWNAANNNGAYC